MKKAKHKYFHQIDFLAIFLSVACAIHCALLPILFSTISILGMNIIHNQIIEIITLIFAFVFAFITFYHQYKHHKKSLKPIIIFSIGYIFLIAKNVFHKYEFYFIFPGVIAIVVAHGYNIYLIQKK